MDEFDRRILTVLQTDASQSVAQIAEGGLVLAVTVGSAVLGLVVCCGLAWCEMRAIVEASTPFKA